MKHRLLWKLTAIHFTVIGTVILVLWLAIDYLAAGYFMILMDRYHISPDEVHALFLGAVHRYLIWASVAAVVLALLLSYWLTRRVLKPLSRMLIVTKTIAAGDYTARVGDRGHDEVGQLGQAFDLMADSLARIERLRRRMVVDAAHELRTPLTNIQGYLEALRDGVIAPSASTFDMLHGEVRRLGKLAEGLLELARADAARANLRLEQVSLRELAEEALALAQPHLEARDLAVHCEFGADADRVQADPDMLRQVLRNLMENVWQYAAKGGRLTIATRKVPEGVRFVCANDGTTFFAEDASFIFERFYRADGSRARDRGGAGIGLAIVKELIEAHGGTVGAAAGGGETRIWFTLPPGSLVPPATQPMNRESTLGAVPERAATEG
jgi:two-component system sensor histidine kinase BaeS